MGPEEQRKGLMRFYAVFVGECVNQQVLVSELPVKENNTKYLLAVFALNACNGSRTAAGQYQAVQQQAAEAAPQHSSSSSRNSNSGFQPTHAVGFLHHSSNQRADGSSSAARDSSRAGALLRSHTRPGTAPIYSAVHSRW